MSEQDDALVRGASFEEEGIPELEEQPVGKILSGETPEGLVPPRDEPLVVEDYGITPAEERAPEPIADRILREEPDMWANTGPAGDGYLRAGRLVAPDAGMVDLDDTPEEVGIDVGERVGLSAEEAAMRIEEEPEGMGGGWPGYLDDEHD